MKYNELKNYKVICIIEADVEDIIARPSDAGDVLLSDYEKDLKDLFGPEKDKEVNIDIIMNCLKSKYGFILSVEPIN